MSPAVPVNAPFGVVPSDFQIVIQSHSMSFLKFVETTAHWVIFTGTPVELAHCTTRRGVTVSVSVPAVWVATFSSLSTEPCASNVPPAPVVTFVLS